VSNSKNCPPIIKDFDDIPVLNSPLCSLLRMDTDHDPVVPVLADPVPRNIGKPLTVGIIMRMIGITRVGRNHLNRIFPGQGRFVPLPAWNVSCHGWSFLVLWKMLQETPGDEFNLTAVRSQTLFLIRIRSQGIWRIPPSAFVKPAQGRCGFVVFREGDDEVAFFLEILIGNIFGQIGDVVLLPDPVLLRLPSVRVVFFEAQPLGQEGEDLKVGLRFPDGLDALFLVNNHPVVASA
jgi:hypothetical protein